MIVTFSTKQLDAALKKARATAGFNDSNPALANFFVQADQETGSATIIATDLQLATICELPCTVERGGVATLPGLMLAKIVGASGAELVKISVAEDGSRASVQTGAYSANLLTLPPDDYPRLEAFDASSAVTCDRKALLEGVARISFSMTDDESRRNIMMVYVDKGWMQASDGNVTTLLKFDPAFNGIQIPALAVRDLLRVLKASDADKVQVAPSSNFLLFRVGSDTFMTRLTTDKFPDIFKLLVKPSDSATVKLTADVFKLRSALRRVEVTVSQKSFSVQLQTTAVGDDVELTLSTNDANGNDSKEVIRVKLEAQAPLALHLNVQKLIDVANAVTGDNFVLRVPDATRVPVRVEDGDSFISFLSRISESVATPPVTAAKSPDAATKMDEL